MYNMRKIILHEDAFNVTSNEIKLKKISTTMRMWIYVSFVR